jgi:hypothetical protein
MECGTSIGQRRRSPRCPATPRRLLPLPRHQMVGEARIDSHGSTPAIHLPPLPSGDLPAKGWRDRHPDRLSLLQRSPSSLVLHLDYF